MRTTIRRVSAALLVVACVSLGFAGLAAAQSNPSSPSCPSSPSGPSGPSGDACIDVTTTTSNSAFTTTTSDVLGSGLGGSTAGTGWAAPLAAAGVMVGIALGARRLSLSRNAG